MSKDSTKNDRVTYGLDVGDKYTHFCVLDVRGQILEEGRFRTTPKMLTGRFEVHPRATIAFEAGTHSAWMHDLLSGFGHKVYVANPRKLRLIYQNPTKDDRVDAQAIARVARLDPKLLAPIVHRTKEARVDREMLNARQTLVETRTKLINHVRGVVKSHGATLPKCGAAAFHNKAVEHIPEPLRPALSPLVDTIRDTTARIREYDKRIETMAETKYPEVEILRSIVGVGVLTALAFVLTLEDPDRFKKSRDVGSYLGLTPRRDKSGMQDKQLRITKAGDRYLRNLLVQAAHYILGPFGTDCDLRRWGTAYLERGGKNAKKRAVVAVARRLAVLMHRLWRNGEVYDPLFLAKRRGEVLSAAPA